LKEVAGQREILAAYGGVKLSEVNIHLQVFNEKKF